MIFELNCYACIEINPEQSEILVTTDSDGKVVEIIIDILMPDDDTLSYAGVHPRIERGKLCCEEFHTAYFFR